MPRAMYVAHARASAELRRIEEDPARLLSPALNLALSLPIALLVGVPTAGVGAGLLLGALLAAVVYLLMRSRARTAALQTQRVIADARVDADQRVALVTKQYEWAVNDVANLRDALRRAEAQVLAVTQPWPAPAAVTAPVPLVTTPPEGDTPSTTLRFESAGVAPAQIRILEDTEVVGISARAIDSRPDEATAFVVAVSERVASAITRGDPRFALEALVNEQWRPTTIRQVPVESRDVVSDKRGRIYASTTGAEPRLAFSIAED